jgi:hypothetical protein
LHQKSVRSSKSVKFSEDINTNEELESVKTAQRSMETKFNDFAANISLQISRLYETMRETVANSNDNQ